MLVDKVVELDSRPLKDFTDLGPLCDEELERVGIYIFTNQRDAKRQCGRNQRVIKVPDPSVFEKTCSFLLAKGITRFIIEGNVFSLENSAEEN